MKRLEEGCRMREVSLVKNRNKVPDDRTASFIILPIVILFKILTKLALILILN
jgi:hypothetical protein